MESNHEGRRRRGERGGEGEESRRRLRAPGGEAAWCLLRSEGAAGGGGGNCVWCSELVGVFGLGLCRRHVSIRMIHPLREVGRRSRWALSHPAVLDLEVSPVAHRAAALW